MVQLLKNRRGKAAPSVGQSAEVTADQPAGGIIDQSVGSTADDVEMVDADKKQPLAGFQKDTVTPLSRFL